MYSCITAIRNVGKLMKTPETVREMFGDNLGLPISNFDDLYTQVRFIYECV